MLRDDGGWEGGGFELSIVLVVYGVSWQSVSAVLGCVIPFVLVFSEI